MRWGVTVLTVALLIALVLASGCADVSFGSQKIGDFGSTKEEQKAVEFFKGKYGDPLTNSGPPRFLEPMVTTGLVNNTPVDKVTKFSKDTGSIFFWVFYDNFKKGDTLTLTWTFNGKTIISLQREAGGDFGRAFGEFLKPDKGWATGTHTITITGGGTSATATFEIIDGATVTVPSPYEQAGRALPVTASTTSGNAQPNASVPLKISASSNTVQWCDNVTFYVSDTSGGGELFLRLRGPGMPPTAPNGISFAYLIQPAAPSIDWKYTWDTSQYYGSSSQDQLIKQAAGYTVDAMDKNQVHVVSMPLQMKGDKLVNGQCPGGPNPDYWISAKMSQMSLSCTPPANVMTFSGFTGTAVTPGTPVQLKIFNAPPTSGTQDLPQTGILIGSTKIDNAGQWQYSWNGNVPGYTLKNDKDYEVRAVLSDTVYTRMSFLYSCPSSQPPAQPPETSGNYPTFTEIYRGASVYIGEERLNLTYALDDANNLPAGSSQVSTPKLAKIGWWAPASIFGVSPPTKILDLSPMYKYLTIDPKTFVGYTGSWYILDESGTKPADTKPLIVVVDPYLDMSIFRYGTNLNPESNGIKLNNGAVVKRGDLIGFSYSTNMNQAAWFTRRSIDKNRGFIDIRVGDPSKAIYQTLRILDKVNEKSGKTWDVSLIWELPYDQSSNWGGVPPNKWDTGVKDANGNYIYASGTYIVQARSSLNNMVDNYRNVGADYTGKTVSPEYTITINP